MSRGATAMKTIQLPDDERGRGENELRRLDRLIARLSRTDLTAAQRRDAERELNALENAPRETADKAWRDQAANETANLAELRGETVSRPKTGPLEIRSRDPLMSLLRTGNLTVEQYDTADALRSAYEARTDGLGSQLGAIGGVGGAHNNDRFVLAGLNRAKALQKVSTAEREILLSPLFAESGTQSHIGLTMIRAICGAGKSLSSQGEGKAYAKNLRAFCISLQVVKEL